MSKTFSNPRDLLWEYAYADGKIAEARAAVAAAEAEKRAMEGRVLDLLASHPHGIVHLGHFFRLCGDGTLLVGPAPADGYSVRWPDSEPLSDEFAVEPIVEVDIVEAATDA